MSSSVARPWWKEATVYQIYPISFFDSNGDGFGDLPGITAKLDYLKNDLGIDVIWLSPIYKSPLKDMGYDISDYKAIDERYGSLQDWDVLLKGVHERGMKLMMDLVVNHTSDQHQWFKDSQKASENKKDWYIWRPAKYDSDGTRHPPNNWRAAFEGSAWTYDSSRDEYFLHIYLPEQPDLNWDNPEVREAVWDIMRFWLDRGCDGFRMDVINLISKTPGLPDAPVTDPTQEWQPAGMYYANGPHVHEYLKEMRSKVLSQYPNLITVGETPYSEGLHDELAKYVLPSRHELDMVFQFDLMHVDAPDNAGWLAWQQWKLKEFKEIVNLWQTFKVKDGFWNATYIENHDQARSVSRFGNTSTSALQLLTAKLLCILQTSQSGTLYVYQGEELGLKNFPRSWGLEEYKDVASQNWYEKIREERAREGREDMSDVLDGLSMKARDHARVPMQWDASSNAGFTTGKPWMRVNDDYKEWNAGAQIGNPDSVLGFWKKALGIRKEFKDSLVYGVFEQLESTKEDDKVFAFTRTGEGQDAVVLLNFSDDDVDVKGLPTLQGHKLILSNYVDVAESEAKLRPYEGKVYVR